MGRYLGEARLPLTDGEEGGVGEASLVAGDEDGGVDESTQEPDGAASSESPWGVRRGHESESCASTPGPTMWRGVSPEVAKDGSTMPTFTTCNTAGHHCRVLTPVYSHCYTYAQATWAAAGPYQSPTEGPEDA